MNTTSPVLDINIDYIYSSDTPVTCISSPSSGGYFFIKLSSKPNKRKPDGPRYAAITNELKESNHILYISPDSLVEHIEQGYAILPAWLDTMEKDTWQAQQMVMIDIDHGMLISEFEAHCKLWGITPNIIYTTFSHTTENPRFRALFCLDNPISDVKIRYILFNKLIKYIFPFIDTACLNPNRLFMGSIPGSVVFRADNERINIVDLIRKVSEDIYNKEPDHQQQAVSRYFGVGKYPLDKQLMEFVDYAEKCAGMDYLYKEHSYYRKSTLAHKILYVTEIKEYNDFIISISHNQPADILFDSEGIFHKLVYKPSNTPKNPISKPVIDNPLKNIRISNNLTELCSICPSLNNYVHDIQDTSHLEKRILYTNLSGLRGSKELFRQVVSNSPFHTLDTIKSYDYYDKEHYKPQSCTHCPYYESCKPSNDYLINMLKINMNSIPVPVHEPVEYISENDARQSLLSSIKRFFNTDTKHHITLLNADTGAGKTTQCIQQWLETPTQRSKFIYAMPTHKLIEDKKNLFSRNDKVFIQTPPPDITTFTELSDEKRTDYLLELELAYRGVSKESGHAVYEKLLVEDITPDNRLLITEYLNNHHSLYSNQSKKLVCTHHAASNILETCTQEEITVVFDEDILPVLLPTKLVNVKLLYRIYKLSESDSTYHRLYEFLHLLINKCASLKLNNNQAIPCSHIKAPPRVKNLLIRLCRVNGIPNNQLADILFLFDSDFYTLSDNDIYCIQFRETILTNNPKHHILIMSATLNQELYKSIIQNINYIEIPHISHKGKIHNVCEYSLSRASIAYHSKDDKDWFPTYIKDNVKKYKLDAIITYKKYVETNPDGSMYLTDNPDIPVYATWGNVSGFDSFDNEYGSINDGTAHLGIFGSPYHPSPVINLLHACIYGVILPVEEYRIEPCEIIRQGFRYTTYTYHNLELQNIHLHLIHAQIEQAIGRARILLDSKKSVFLFNKMPVRNARITRPTKKRQETIINNN